jgi:hypothetical protein
MWNRDYLDNLTERYQIVHELLHSYKVIDLCAGSGW